MLFSLVVEGALPHNPAMPGYEAYLHTFLLSFLPLLELRFSIPYAYTQYDMPIHHAVGVSALGGVVTVAVMLLALHTFVPLAERHMPWLHKILKKIFTKTRKRHSKKMALMGEAFLILFVAIPLPGSGSFTGSLVCYLFGVSYWKSVLLVGVGIVLSGIIVGGLTVGSTAIWNLFTLE